jgi:hypothetical protein
MIWAKPVTSVRTELIATETWIDRCIAREYWESTAMATLYDKLYIIYYWYLQKPELKYTNTEDRDRLSEYQNPTASQHEPVYITLEM